MTNRADERRISAAEFFLLFTQACDAMLWFVSVLYLLYFCHVVLFGVLFIIFVCQLQAHVGFTHVFCDSTCLPGRLVTFCGGAIQKKVLRFLPS